MVEPQMCAGTTGVWWNDRCVLDHMYGMLTVTLAIPFYPQPLKTGLTCYSRGRQDVTSSNLLLNGDLFVQNRHSLGSWEQVDS